MRAARGSHLLLQSQIVNAEIYLKAKQLLVQRAANRGRAGELVRCAGRFLRPDRSTVAARSQFIFQRRKQFTVACIDQCAARALARTRLKTEARAPSRARLCRASARTLSAIRRLSGPPGN
jgi:hypothetical protein